ncbi:MAG: hypothetical protein JO005_14720, partial [Gammaproteobacteria bacterium]|nr:hypothetical protein [Gammaproteobacteria bacterium]
MNAPALGPLAAATPELALAAGICALLLIDVFAARRGLSATLALLIIAVCAALT